ncbi:MAG: 4Fe-4S ferredoxin, partial [Chloroflexota bacterium]
MRKLINPSTVEFAREARRTRAYSLFDFLHGMVYGRWVYLYISLGTGRHPQSPKLAAIVRALGRLKPRKPSRGGSHKSAGTAETYHGKVVPLEAAKQLVRINQEIRITNLEHIIPFARARDIILKNPDHIVLLDCPCRVSKPNPCLPLDVCLIVGEPFASFVVEHHPSRSRR